MIVNTARQILPISTRLDWRRPRLSYVPRLSYGEPDSFRTRLERRLRAYLRKAWSVKPRY